MKATISKSRFKQYMNCHKQLWLSLYKPELGKDVTDSKQIEDGKIVGKYAKQYFENTVDVTTYDENGELDTKEMIGLTNRYLTEGNKVIAEASFSVNNLFCSVDLLKPTENGYYIYEVKASTNVEDDHCIDVAFQKYVLEQRGLKVNKIYILHLDNTYIRHGDINVKQLFIREDVTTDARVLVTLQNMKKHMSDIKDMLSKDIEPEVLLSTNCKECPFKDYCHRDVPTPSVLDINALRGRYDYFNSGIKTFNDVIASNVKLNQRQKVQVLAVLNNKEVTIDKPALKQFLNTIRYPIYHLDFESIQLPIPPCDGAWPYEQIPTQYSLHIEYKDGRLEHKEFLGDSIDPRRAIAESLCKDIPSDACVMAYNKAFECGRIEELADLYPDLGEHLIKIRDNVVDLLIPFKSGAYYHIKMGGSNSIKYVLPALCPNEPELDYHALPVVHNGAEAMDIYPRMLEASPEEKQRIRDGLLKYCCLDTLAMVKVLRKIAKDK